MSSHSISRLMVDGMKRARAPVGSGASGAMSDLRSIVLDRERLKAAVLPFFPQDPSAIAAEDGDITIDRNVPPRVYRVSDDGILDPKMIASTPSLSSSSTATLNASGEYFDFGAGAFAEFTFGGPSAVGYKATSIHFWFSVLDYGYLSAVPWTCTIRRAAGAPLVQPQGGTHLPVAWCYRHANSNSPGTADTIVMRITTEQGAVLRLQSRDTVATRVVVAAFM